MMIRLSEPEPQDEAEEQDSGKMNLIQEIDLEVSGMAGLFINVYEFGIREKKQ